MTDTGAALVKGARQCGKSTVATEIGDAHGAEWRSLDNARIRQAAAADPTGFVTSGQPMVIDEVQRVPELILAIKEAADADYRPGQFLLTGSARVMSLRSVPDSLVGRMQTVELWPLSQGEIDDQPDGFVEAAFAQEPDLRHSSEETREGYIDRIVRGGFPAAVATPKAAFVDSGIAATLMRTNAQRLRQPGSPLGPLVEGFVATEIARQLTWAGDWIEMYHYRTKDEVEVDIVLENSVGQVIGIEVKAGATTRNEDFAGLRHLQAHVGDDFLAGFVLDMGRQTLPFGPKLRAMPIASIWETPGDRPD